MASIEEANLLFKNLVTYEKSVVMAKKYVKYHKAVVEDLKRLEKLEKDLKYLNEQKIEQWNFPNGRIILGIDITNMPSNEEVKKRILKETIKRLIGNE